jgi:hypothetical protein
MSFTVFDTASYTLLLIHCSITAEEIPRLQVGIGYQTFNDDTPVEVRGSEGPYYVRRVTKVIMDRTFYYQSLVMVRDLYFQYFR